MQHIVFDKLNFKRIGFGPKDNETKFKFKVGIAKKEQESDENDNQEDYLVRLEAVATRENEFKATICVTGFFEIAKDTKDKQLLLKQNAVAILFPFVRSEFTLLTTQPETDPVVLPIMNIVEMMNDAEETDLSKDALANSEE
jgi:preprotein translocase subunit SecB